MLFDTNTTRWPDQYADLVRPYIKAMRDGFWTAEKFTFDSDKKDYFNVLSDQERGIIERTLAAIAQIEVKVKEFWSLLGRTLRHPSMSDLGITMANVEVIHNEAYEKLLMVLGLQGAFLKNMEVPALANRVKYLNKHADKTFANDRKQFIYSLILFTLFVENVSLFSQFYIILNFNRFKSTTSQQVLKDTANQVKYTRNEELLHAQAGIAIINQLRKEYPELFDAELEAKVKEECQEAYSAEAKLIDWMLDDYEGEKLDPYILRSYVADRLNQSLVAIGYEPQFNVSEEALRDTFWMVEGQFAPARVDFFNSDPIGYSQADTADEDEF